jgi:hypothetical protein
MPEPMPMTPTEATTTASRPESWKKVGPWIVRGLGVRRSSACSIGSAAGSVVT